MYGSWDMEHDRQFFFLILDHYFCPPPPLTAQKINEKTAEISSFYARMCTKNYDQMMYGSWNMMRDRRTDKKTYRGGSPT